MKNFFKQSLPLASQVKSDPKLQFFGTLLHDPNLWCLNRRALAGGTAVGLFIAFVPIPMQMLLAAITAIWFRVNLPLSISLVWVTNPITIPPLFYFAYKLGAFVLGMSITETEFSFSQEWLLYTLGHFLQPLLLGSLLLGALSALCGYLLISFLWRVQVTQLWRRRRKRRLKKLLAESTFGELNTLSTGTQLNEKM